MSLKDLRAKSEPSSRGDSSGEEDSVSSGRPVIASAKRWNCDMSVKGSVGESQVCGRTLSATFSRVVE